MARSWKLCPAGRGGVIAGPPVVVRTPGTIMPGDAGVPSGWVSIMRGAVPSGVTTDRGGGSGDGDDDPMRFPRIGFAGTLRFPFLHPRSGWRDLVPGSSRMIE